MMSDPETASLLNKKSPEEERVINEYLIHQYGVSEKNLNIQEMSVQKGIKGLAKIRTEINEIVLMLKRKTNWLRGAQDHLRKRREDDTNNKVED